MLTTRKILSHRAPRTRQQGVVLVIALIVLVAMTLAGLALVRSVDTTNIIAGNLAFRQAATHAGDKGIEAAIAWLSSASASDNVLAGSEAATGYSAKSSDPSAGQNWGAFWTGSLDGISVTLTPNQDAAGNTVKYVIQRLCRNTGASSDPNAACTFAPLTENPANSLKQGQPGPNLTPQALYRITVQVTGPRSTTSYIQAIVTK